MTVIPDTALYSFTSKRNLLNSVATSTTRLLILTNDPLFPLAMKIIALTWDFSSNACFTAQILRLEIRIKRLLREKTETLSFRGNEIDEMCSLGQMDDSRFKST